MVAHRCTDRGLPAGQAVDRAGQRRWWWGRTARDVPGLDGGASPWRTRSGSWPRRICAPGEAGTRLRREGLCSSRPTKMAAGATAQGGARLADGRGQVRHDPAVGAVHQPPGGRSRRRQAARRSGHPELRQAPTCGRWRPGPGMDAGKASALGESPAQRELPATSTRSTRSDSSCAPRSARDSKKPRPPAKPRAPRRPSPAIGPLSPVPGRKCGGFRNGVSPANTWRPTAGPGRGWARRGSLSASGRWALLRRGPSPAASCRAGGSPRG